MGLLVCYVLIANDNLKNTGQRRLLNLAAYATFIAAGENAQAIAFAIQSKERIGCSVN
jgi:hypothetical protein